MGKIIGIDLGTTTSEVAFLKDGVPTIVKNIGEDNSSVIPSVVLIEKNDIKVGIKAKNKQILSPKNVISEVKRLIGTDEKITIEGKEYKPEQIAAMILKKIKSVAEFYIGEEVEEAVITVPANFNERERRATKDAGKIAGIKVERIINEPTAAALAYGINNLENNSNILVYDLGGGTFDVTILEYFEGILDVKVSRGNNRLGGKDIDSILLDLVLKKFKEKNSFNINLEDKRVKTALLTAIKEGKENLSFDEEVEIIVPYVAVDENYNPIDLEVTIKRREFEDNLKFIIDKSFEVIDETLRVADLDKNEIDKIILVGGSTRIPFLRKTIEQYFGEKIVSGINPEEIVALGAAVQGGLKKGLLDKATIILTDSCSHSLGLEVLGGKFDPIIKRDDKLPISVKKVYKTVEDNQEVVEINIYEGEEKAVENNNFIGSFEILDIPRAKRGKEKIEVVFDYDLNGILDVQATIVSTEKVATKKITLKGLTSKEIEVMEEQLREIESFKVNEIILEEKVEKLENNKEIEKKVIVRNEVVEEDKKEEELVVEETSESDSEEEEEEEEYTAEHLYMDVKKITNYYNYRVEHLEPTVKKEAGDLLQDLVGAVKKADAKGGLALINKILELIQE